MTDRSYVGEMPVMSTQINHTATQPPLVRLLNELWKSRAIHVAVRLHLAEALANGPLSVAELAAETGSHAPSLYRLLRTLACIGIFTELHGSRFANSTLSHLLRPDVPGSMYAIATMMSSDWWWRAWGELLHSVQTGEPGFNKAHGMSMWRYFAEHDPAAGEAFNTVMTDLSAMVSLPLAQAADLSRVRTVVDVGGGHGGLLTTLLAIYPSIEKGILFDQAHVIDEARTALGPVLDPRIQLIGGDFFTTVPGGADAYVMKWILHDWDDSACVQILTNCRRAMASHSRLLVAEYVFEADQNNEDAYFQDLLMLVLLPGKERTKRELRALYDAAGLRMTRIIPTTSRLSLIEGVQRGSDKTDD
jgi:O-methyltransferase domain/IclR helix-turn-helix domain